MQEVNDALALQSATNLEFFYWVSIALMFLIHAGFLVYETGASRVKNVLASAMKNLMTLAVVIPSFFLVGWFLYNSMPTGVPRLDELAKAVLPWSDNMGPNLQDSASGVFWGCFALFAATTASILSGALIERVRLSAFLIMGAFLGSVVWIIGAAWGWHPAGWMLTELGFHDVGAAGCVHVVAGAFALGVLINLGPRIGRFVQGRAFAIRGHNLTLSMLGLMLIYVGFFGFLMGCVIYSGEGFTTIYGTPTNLSAWVFNILMGLAGGIVGAYLASRGEPFWCVSGGLAGVIASAAGLDVYHPAVAFVVSAIGGVLMVYIGGLVERARIDDAVGAVAVHGGAGLWSLVAVGIFASGYPNVEGVPDVSIGGQLVGAVTFAALGFIPGYLCSKALAVSGRLRVPRPVEIAGLDLSEVPASAFPEGIPATPAPLIAATALAHENGKPHDPIAEPAAS